MRHYIEIIYPGEDTRAGVAGNLGLAVIPVSGDVLDVWVRRERAGTWGGTIEYDISVGVNSTSLATIFGTPAHRPQMASGSLYAASNPLAFPVAVTKGHSIKFIRPTHVPGGDAGSRPTVIVEIEDGNQNFVPLSYLDTDVTLAANSDVKVATQKAVKAYSMPISYLDTDVTLAANSDSKVATQKAVKTYALSLFAANDALVYKGSIDASANPNYPAADAGHTYRISVAGKIGGAAGVNVEIGDLLLCLVDGSAAGNHATVGANWDITQNNLDGAVIGAAASTNNAIVLWDGVTGKLIKDSAKTLPTGTVVGTSDTQTLTNKRVNARVGTVVSSATPTPDADAHDEYTVTALAVNAVFAAPTGTPVEGQPLMIRIKDAGVSKTLGFNAIYRIIGTTLPAATVANKTVYVGCIYNAADSKWDVLGVNQEV